MIKRNNKKGFTIVELVIVIAVIAILAAVLIPTFAGIIRKANISADTQLVKNMNTALAADEAINGPAEDFNDVIAIVRDAGYILSAFNPTTEGCYVVWESDSNQLLLVDGKKDFEVIYNVEDYTAAGATWYFAVDSEEAKAELKAHYGETPINIEMAITDAKALNTMLAAGGTQEIYIDESLVLDKDNLLVFNKAATTTINLGKAQLNTNGLLEGEVPIQIEAGTVTINGGVIGGGGAYIDADGNRVNSSLETAEGSTVTLNGTEFNVAASGYVTFKGDATLKNVKIDSEGMGVYCGGNGDVVLEKVTINSAGRCVWATNYDGVNHTNKSATITIKSGTYNGGTGTFSESYAAVTVVAYSGDIVIEGGNFTTGSGKLFQVMESHGSITLKDGTFEGKTLSELGQSGIEALCNGTFKVTDNKDGTFTITLN